MFIKGNKKNCRIAYFNIAFFASVMGFGGLAIATHKLESIFELETHFGEYILYASLLYFFLVLFFYILKIFINFSDVKADFLHPVKSNFFPGIGKIFIIFSIGFLSINTEFSGYFFWIGLLFQFVFAVILFRRWLLKENTIESLNPLWFLPIVGNLLIPIAGVPLGYSELSWFFFAVGFVMWMVMFTVMMNRIIFHHPLPKKLLPTLFIFIAPPAVSFIAYTVLRGGELTDFGRVMYYFSVFLFIIFLSKINILRKLKFFMSWWAYSFPMAVFTTATFLYFSKTGEYIIFCMGMTFFTFLLLIITGLLVRTLIGIQRKELCQEET